MRAIKALTALAMAAALLWCGYWFIGERALDRAIRHGLAQVPEIEAQDFSILGFPNRFDVTFTEPRIHADGAE